MIPCPSPWRRTPVAALVLAVGVLAGCAGASTDPRSGGLAGGISGIMSGEYERRLEERQESTRQLDVAEARMGERLAGNRTRLRDLEESLAKRRAALTRTKNEIAALSQAIPRVELRNDIMRGEQSDVAAKIQRRKALYVHAKTEQDRLEKMIQDQEQHHDQEALLQERSRKEAARTGTEPPPTTIEDLLRRSVEDDKRRLQIEEQRKVFQKAVAQISA